MSEPDWEDARRTERIRALMEKDRAAEQNFDAQSLLGSTVEASVRDLPAPADRATVLAVDVGMALLQYADTERSRYWVPLINIRWLKAIR